MDVTKLTEFAAAVKESLQKKPQRELPSKYFYDAIGSDLFNRITRLPEYGLTRADARILQNHSEEIIDFFPAPLAIVELGSGDGKKTRFLLEILSKQVDRFHYYPIEISSSALTHCKERLSDLHGISIVGLQESYIDGLQKAAGRRLPDEKFLVLFLGSSIGNFEPKEAERFLKSIRLCLSPGDGLLLGTDLVKPRRDLISAYDDSLGVTAAFNLNILARINRELDGTFDLANFVHEARYNESESRIEMHLRSKIRQSIKIGKADFEFTMEPGETIWTEASYKFHPDEIAGMAARAGFTLQKQWLDREWPFAENLLLNK